MAKPGFVPASALSQTRKTILYVDDMKYSLISLKKGLEKYYEIYLADSNEKMYKLLEKVKPNLFLLDVNMPDVDGYETIRDLKADDRFAEIPVIFLTCASDKENVVKGMSLGAADYIIKPFSTEKLIESIENQFVPKAAVKTKKIDKSIYNPSVLVVDDFTSMLRTINYALHDRYNVHLLSKSEVVIDFLQNNKMDLILLDYLMPGLSGFDLVPRIRALSDYKFTPIIIITTEGTLKNVNDAIALGASDFIVKPFDPKELNFKVDRQIRQANEVKEKAENEFLLD